MLLVAAGKGPAGVTILVGPTNLHLEKSVTGFAAESSCGIHAGYISAGK